MQSIIDFWKTSIGKVVILGGGGVLGLLSLCFACTICGTLFGDSGEDQVAEVTRKIVSFSTEEPTSEPTATLESSPTSKPIATPVPIADAPEPTPTPMPEPTDTPEVNQPPVVTAGESDINMRNGPGTDYDIVGTLSAGKSLEIVGRNSDSSWWQVSAPDGLCWVAAGVTTVSNVDDSIPVVEAPPVPTLTEPPLMVEPTTELPPPEPVATEPPPVEVCDCSGNHLNCGDFGTHASAQACYEYCKSIGRGDVHGLDRDDDGTACDPSNW
jgi:uncharacterized protein YraI